MTDYISRLFATGRLPGALNFGCGFCYVMSGAVKKFCGAFSKATGFGRGAQVIALFFFAKSFFFGAASVKEKSEVGVSIKQRVLWDNIIITI